jgi:hypothetical protein
MKLVLRDLCVPDANSVDWDGGRGVLRHTASENVGVFCIPSAHIQTHLRNKDLGRLLRPGTFLTCRALRAEKSIAPEREAFLTDDW